MQTPHPTWRPILLVAAALAAIAATFGKLQADSYPVPETGGLQTGFTFADFSEMSALNLIGEARQSQQRLRLTAGDRSSTGAAWYVDKVFVAGEFETTFQFQLATPEGKADGSDGFALLIQNSTPVVMRGGGGNLGYGGTSNSIAIEFDVWGNSEFQDPSPCHISIHTNGRGANGANEKFSLGSFTPQGFLLDDAKVHTARIRYSAGKLAVFLDVHPVMIVEVNLDTTLELDRGRAWIGFTAASGGTPLNQDVLNWSFSAKVRAPRPVDRDVTDGTRPAPAPRVAIADDAAGDPKLIEKIELLGGRVERQDLLPGRPVVGVVFRDSERFDEKSLHLLVGFKNLTNLDLVRTSITNLGLKELGQLSNLTMLDLGDTRITDADVKELRQLKTLTRLHLNVTEVTDVGLQELRGLNNLTELGIGKTRITDAGLKELAAAHKNLMTIDLLGTQITDAGMKELRELKNLTSLNLCNTRVTDAGLRELRELNALSNLNLWGCTQITDAGMRELAAALPNLQINRPRRDPLRQ